MKRSILLITIALLSVASIAQEKGITLEQAVLGQWSEFRPTTLSSFAWRPQADAFTYTDKGNLIEQNCLSGATHTLITLDEINAVLRSQSLPELQRLLYTWTDNSTIKLISSDNMVLLNVAGRTIVQSLTFPKGNNHDLSPDMRKVAYTVDNNLYMKNGNVAMPITNDLEKGIVNGQSVHRNEFGVNKGTFWSPKSTHIAFYRMDETMVADYPLVDISQRIATLKGVKYPMAGMKSHEVTLHIFNIETKQTVAVATGEPRDQYLTNVAWSPSGKSIYIAVLNREQNHLKLNRYSATTGKLEATLFEETDQQYVEPLNPMVFLESDTSKFIWQSRRDGWNHLYLYNVNGKLEKQLTRGRWEVDNLLAIDTKKQVIYISTTKNSPIERHTYAINVKNGQMSSLTAGDGTHSVNISPDFAYYMDFYSSISIPNSVNLYSAKRKLVRNIITAKNPYEGYSNVSMPQLVVLQNNNGDTLYGRIIKPISIDANRRYPVVIYVYGGPHSQLVTNSWLTGARLWECYMANKGYVLFTLDNRGTAARGADFEQIIHRNLGVYELDDQLVGLNYLKSLSYIDTNRIGVHGWSYGGFLTTALMLKSPQSFKAGVAGGPVTDWKFYEVMYGERYMDTPQENPKGYENADLKNFTRNLKGKFMIIHDDMDDTVVPQNSLTLIQQFVKDNVQMDFFVYPQHGHNVRGKDRVHLINKVITYFENNL